jgi:hypothetical protein
LSKSGRSPHVFCTNREAFPELGKKEGKHVIRFRYIHKHVGTNRRLLTEPVELLMSGNKTQIAGITLAMCLGASAVFSRKVVELDRYPEGERRFEI